MIINDVVCQKCKPKELDLSNNFLDFDIYEKNHTVLFNIHK